MFLAEQTERNSIVDYCSFCVIWLAGCIMLATIMKVKFLNRILSMY